jgi:hypothetical protein
MMERFRALSGSSKALIVGAIVAVGLCVVLLVVVLATGGFTNPF